MNPMITSITTSGNNTNCLTKYVNPSFKERDMKSLLEFLIDPNRDDLNPGYNAADSRLLNTITEYYRGHTNNDGAFELAYVSSTTHEPVTVKLNQIVGSISDICHQRSGSENGFDGTYDEIQLLCEYDSVGAK